MMVETVLITIAVLLIGVCTLYPMWAQHKRRKARKAKRWGGEYRIMKRTKYNGKSVYTVEEFVFDLYGEENWRRLANYTTCCNAEEHIEGVFSNRVETEEEITSCKR